MTRTEVVIAALGLEIASRRGPRAWLRCPYHDDKSPTNFFVRIAGERSGQNHCFSCKRGGGLTYLVMHVRNCDEKAARAFIAALGKGYEPPRARVSVVSRQPRLGRARFTMPREVVFEPLADWVALAREYAEGRGITQHEVERFGLGYAVDGRLAGRVVIPWLGAGRVAAGYSARTFVGAEPKYQTPPADVGADRSVMVGEHLWPPLGERRVIAVVEGALNGIALQRVAPALPFGALGGSEVDPGHALKLATFPRVLLLTDPDMAGDAAAAHLERMLARYCETNRVVLPRGNDAMDLVMNGRADELRARLSL